MTERITGVDKKLVLGSDQGAHRIGHVVDSLLARATVAYLWVGVAIFLTLSSPTVIWPDSQSYRDVTHRNFELVLRALEGRTVRSPTIILPFTLFGSDRTIEIGQAVLLGVAFTFLVLTVYRVRTFHTTTKAVLGLIFATTLLAPALMSWNLQILSESLSVSYAVIAATASLRFLIDWRSKWLLLSGVASMLAISAKPALAVAFIPLLTFESASYLHRAASRQRERSQRLRGILAAILVAMGTAGMVGTGALYASMQARARRTPYQEASILYLSGAYDPINGPLRRSLQASGIPRCVSLRKALTTFQIVALEIRKTSCPQFAAWSVQHFTGWYARFLLDHPGDVRFLLADLLPGALGYDLHSQGVYTVIPPLADAIWGTIPALNTQDQAQAKQPLSRKGGFEDLLLVGILAVNAGGIWLIVARRRHRYSVASEGLRLYLYFLYLMDVAVIVIVWQLLVLPQGNNENARLALEANVLARVSLILALGLVSSWLLDSWRGRRHRDDSLAWSGVEPLNSDR